MQKGSGTYSLLDIVMRWKCYLSDDKSSRRLEAHKSHPSRTKVKIERKTVYWGT
jgi:hypothetical protein